MTSGGTRNFFVEGDIEGAKCDSEGEKSKNLPKMADFDHFFLLTGERGDRASDSGGGGQMPPMPPLDAATDDGIGLSEHLS